MDGFWEGIDAQLDEIAVSGATFDAVRAVLGGGEDANSAFFGGSGGDRTLQSALRRAGWVFVKGDAIYYVMQHEESGELLTYVEGDVLRGDQYIGDHDVVAHSAPGMGVWIECECGWIGPSRASEREAFKTHAAHVGKVAHVLTIGESRG